MDCKIKYDIGTIYITEDVLLKVVGYAALECYGIVAMSSKRAKDGIVEWLGRENLSKGVQIRSVGDMLDVDLFYEEVPEQIEETSDDEGVTVYTSIAPRPIVEELESRIVMAHRSCYTQMTTDLKRVLRETEISSSALAASESRLYGYSLLRLLPSRYAEKLGLEREALQDVQQIGDFLDHLDGDRMNMLMRSVIFDCMDHIEEFRQTDETFELQLLRQFALQQDKETSERVIAEHLDRLEKTQSRLEEQLHALEQRKAQELAAEVEAFDPVVPEDPDILQENPAEDAPEPEGEPLDPDLWPEASASLAA